MQIRTLDDENLDDGDRKLLDDVAETGWHVVLIEEERGGPGWAFSVGLYHNYGHPELVLFGLPLDHMASVINDMGEEIFHGGSFPAEKEYGDLLEGVKCMVKPVKKCWYRPFLGHARWFYRGDDFLAVQCIWPDKEQHFPWESQFKTEWLWTQPLLYESKAHAARAEKLLETLRDEAR